ncbi:hypothetical protein K08M3_50980 [Vibrio alginolyticus]|jgi:hypothetical protein|uniref:Uncharacterized protein n=1 Tax=Vibrio alginolyticus TaxID=663 RepID=A0A1W6V9K9_VIBAL|nr:hypothetical protein K04M1_50850 [Vibrio alginolyticus]NYU23912.1 hypothetical protein [Vibrio parahaemolyticus]ARP11741.1 hypothetical protein K04M3_51720 [Vibrio alginolyticus]ARP16794.1 hypothetical protein K04M5_51420 [Vibrio alginolyticus]ARP21831.1 hypothetical protein K05K4_51290 [Vibrio alginolyticus]
MFYSIFDWKIKLGIVVTVLLAVCTIISFILAWTATTPIDGHTAINQYLKYRWFASFIVSFFMVGAATLSYHHNSLKRH